MQSVKELPLLSETPMLKREVHETTIATECFLFEILFFQGLVPTEAAALLYNI